MRPGFLGFGFIHSALGDFSGEGDCPDTGFPIYSVTSRNCSITYDEPNPRHCCKCALHEEIMSLKKDSDDRYSATGPQAPDAFMARRAKELEVNLRRYNGWTDSNTWGKGCAYASSGELLKILAGVFTQSSAAITREAAAIEAQSASRWAVKTAPSLAQKQGLLEAGKSSSDIAAETATYGPTLTAFKREAAVYGTAASQTGYDVGSLVSGEGWRPTDTEGPLGRRRKQVRRPGQCDPGDIVCKIKSGYDKNKKLYMAIAIGVVGIVVLAVLRPYFTILSKIV